MTTRRLFLSGLAAALAAPAVIIPTRALAQRSRKYWYFGPSTHIRDPDSIRVSMRMIPGGGGGMGSLPDMSFGGVPYYMYGGPGQPSCFDTITPHTCQTLDGYNFSWPGHPLTADDVMFVTGNQGKLWYVHGPSLTANTFALSDYPYVAPGVVKPYVPHNFVALAQLEFNVYVLVNHGGNGGGIIGDQAVPGVTKNVYSETPYPSSTYETGQCGGNVLGGGGRGGGAGGGVEQYGASNGNDGVNGTGGGGGGAGFMRANGSYPTDIYGPGGGAGGGSVEAELDLKPFYLLHGGLGGHRGSAYGGPNGFEGGLGGNGVVIVWDHFV